MTITVTQEDIDNGVRSRCACCPVALAVKRMYPGRAAFAEFDWVDIDGVKAWIPYEATEFIHRFDRGVPVQPITFEIFP